MQLGMLWTIYVGISSLKIKFFAHLIVFKQLLLLQLLTDDILWYVGKLYHNTNHAYSVHRNTTQEYIATMIDPTYCWFSFDLMPITASLRETLWRPVRSGDLALTTSSANACRLVPTHHEYICCFIVTGTLKNKLRWNLNQKTYILIEENAFEIIECKVSANFTQCVEHPMLCFKIYPDR